MTIEVRREGKNIILTIGYMEIRLTLDAARSLYNTLRELTQ